MNGHIKSLTVLSLAIALAVFPAVSSAAASNAVLIKHVPAYYWYHGCGPTALGMIFGYYDLHGYDDLFPAASGWDQVKNAQVWNASESKWDPVPDVAENITHSWHVAYYEDPLDPDGNNDDWKIPVPEGASTPPVPESIAGFFKTSVDPEGGSLADGASPLATATDAVIDFADSRGYAFSAVNWLPAFDDILGPIIWNDIKTHIDNGRPLMFVVKTPAGFNPQPPDHYVTVVGYDEGRTCGDPDDPAKNSPEGGDICYAFYNTYDEDESVVKWAKWQDSTTHDWGVSNITFVKPRMQLSHAILLLQTLSGGAVPSVGDINPIQVIADVDGDGKKGLAELLHIFQEIAGQRPSYPAQPYVD